MTIDNAGAAGLGSDRMIVIRAGAAAAGRLRLMPLCRPARVRAALLLTCALLWAACYAVDARITDVSGRTYDVSGVRLFKGSVLYIDCGGVRIKTRFKSVKSMKLNPAKITSIDGKLHFGVELLLQDGTVRGSMEEGARCYVPAANGLRGKSSKAKIRMPLEKVNYVYILGKEDKEKKAPAAGGSATSVDSEKELPAASEKEPPADSEEKQPEGNEENRTEGK